MDTLEVDVASGSWIASTLDILILKFSFFLGKIRHDDPKIWGVYVTVCIHECKSFSDSQCR